MPELLRRTIVGAAVDVGELQAPAHTADGRELPPASIKVLVVTDLEEGIETIVYVEPGTEAALAQALTGGIVLARAGDLPGANSR
jgi:hypothetical protein